MIVNGGPVLATVRQAGMMAGVRVRPVSRNLLIGEIAASILDLATRSGSPTGSASPAGSATPAASGSPAGSASPTSRCVRVAVDGAAGLEPDTWAADIADELRNAGRFALAVSVQDFLLPASQRFEFGRENPDAFYEGWRDEGGLRREVLDPAGSDGNGRVLPALWRTDIDRSARADYIDVPPGGVVIVGGEFLLGGGLPFEYAIHLTCSAAALARRTPADRVWTLPAHERYADEVSPSTFADLVVRLEDPRRPAVVEPDAAPE